MNLLRFCSTRWSDLESDFPLFFLSDVSNKRLLECVLDGLISKFEINARVFGAYIVDSFTLSGIILVICAKP